MSSAISRRSKATTVLLAAFASALVLAALLLGADDTSAQQAGPTPADFPSPVSPPDQDNPGTPLDLPPLQGKINPPKHKKLDSTLNRIAERAEQNAVAAGTGGAAPSEEEPVGVTFYIEEGKVEGVEDYLESKDVSIRNVGVDYIEAYVPPSLLVEASSLTGVINIRTISLLRPAQGTLISPGVALHGADEWQAAGYKGAGIKIGVIDSGFNGFWLEFYREHYPSFEEELPQKVHARCYRVVDGKREVIYESWDIDGIEDCGHGYLRYHGSAVTEAIYDFAPEATYYIAHVESIGDMAAAADWMIDNGVDVINMSMGASFDGPGDGTSPNLSLIHI